MLFVVTILLFSALSAVAAESGAGAAADLGALTARLGAASAAADAVRTAATRSAAARRDANTVEAAAAAYASVLGRKRNGGDGAAPLLCADGGDASVDTDLDGHPDCVDACPRDPRKTRPGACGCGASDVDADGDGVADCADACPLDAAKTAPGVCGCGAADSGCGCDVTPLAAGSCAAVRASAAIAPGDAARYVLFAPDGGVAARVELPAGALVTRADERVALRLVAPAAAADGDAQLHSAAALDLSLVNSDGTDASRARTANGVPLERAARVCLPPLRAAPPSALCLAFSDAASGGALKCFEAALEAAGDGSGLLCGRVPLLTRVQLARASRHTSLAPYVSGVEPRVLPADGAVALRIAGGHFDRGVLAAATLGGAPIDVAGCRVLSARAIECDAAPAGRGDALELALEFTVAGAADMRAHAALAAAASYAAPLLHAVELVGDELHVRGEHFGPAGALHADAVLVDGVRCAEPRVLAADALLACSPPPALLAKRAAPSHARHAAHTVSVRMHRHAAPVHSSPAHYVRRCAADGEFRCADGACVESAERCAACASGWALCPLGRPVLPAGGRCSSLRAHAAAPPAAFDATLDASAPFALAVGADAALAAPAHAGPAGGGKHCVSVAAPAAAVGFASAVYNVSVAREWRGRAQLALTPLDAAADAYGLCMARWNCDAARWECVDEQLEAAAAPHGERLAGDVPVRAGDNLYALIEDNCPGVLNPSQLDSDGNGVGDACDAHSGLVAAARDRSAGNSKYVAKILKGTSYSVEEQPCPYAGAHVAVLDSNGVVYRRAVDAHHHVPRPLPLDAEE